MTIKEQLLQILERSRETELAFMASLSEEDKAEAGSYEKWSAKDNLAHANYWLDLRAAQAFAFARDEDFGPVPQYEQANVEVYERYAGSDWDEVGAIAEQAHAKMLETIQSMDDEELSGPSAESEERKMWESLVGSAYSHKLTHYSQFYQDRDRMKEVGTLWKEWVEAVSPLDSGPDWQGGVHYNAACSLALAGEKGDALEELKVGLELRPGLKYWSRLDSDLAALHDDSGYKELFAPAYWWKALEAGAQVETLADQWLRMLFMLRYTISTVPADSWQEGETLYQRPAGLALHIIQSIDFYTAEKPGEGSKEPLTQINWEVRDSTKLPTQAALLEYLDKVEERLAHFLIKMDFQAEEGHFNWTGKTILSRTIYSLRHSQHHLADLAMEMKRRGLKPPDWQ
jgi:hypothetical protein